MPVQVFSPTTTRADSIHKDGVLIDRYGRHITYIRLSVTDRCDFRCRYCMPLQVDFLPKKEILSLEELLQVARVFVSLGVDKIRLTGGEPLVRRNVIWLCEQIAKIAGVRELAITTNGTQLPKLANDLALAGVQRVNISLDSLNNDRFRRLTRTGSLAAVKQGIDAALAANFPGGVKLNTVMMRGINDDELPALVQYAMIHGMDISFIEEMPLGDIGLSRADTHFDAISAHALIGKHFSLHKSDHNSGGPARYWQVEGHNNRIGFITPHSHNFCQNCNRVRITAGGELYPCLGQNDAVNLKPALRDTQNSDDALRRLITKTMEIKPKGHDFNVFAENAKVVRFMSTTGG